jgi:hypothetical protein
LYAGSGTTSNAPEDQSGGGDSEEIHLDRSGGDLDDNRDFMRELHRVVMTLICKREI